MRVRLGRRQAAHYRAEGAALAALGMRWSTIAEVRRYVDGILATQWFETFWPDVLYVHVERSRDLQWSCATRMGGDGVIVLGRLVQPSVLHELAHVCSPPDEGHGECFASNLLVFVRKEMGFHAYGTLLHHLRLEGLTASGSRPP